MSVVGTLFQPVSQRGTVKAAQSWYDSRDPQSKVGSKHHIVPQAILRRFATSTGRISVRDRFTNKQRLASIGDLAVRDFYTFVDNDHELNGVMEDWLGAIESEFARVVRPYLDWTAFRRDRPLTSAERFAVDTFTAVQMLRGMRTRRSMELLAEYHLKLLNEHVLTPDELTNLQGHAGQFCIRTSLTLGLPEPAGSATKAQAQRLGTYAGGDQGSVSRIWISPCILHTKAIAMCPSMARSSQSRSRRHRGHLGESVQSSYPSVMEPLLLQWASSSLPWSAAEISSRFCMQNGL